MNISFFGLALGKNEQFDISQFFFYLTSQVRRCLRFWLPRKNVISSTNKCTRSIFRLINNSSIHGTKWSEAFFLSIYKYISRLQYSKSFVYTTWNLQAHWWKSRLKPRIERERKNDLVKQTFYLLRRALVFAPDISKKRPERKCNDEYKWIIQVCGLISFNRTHNKKKGFDFRKRSTSNLAQVISQ